MGAMKVPSPLYHVVSTTPLILGKKWLNILTLFIASVFPDVLAIALTPVLVLVFGLHGERLNWFFTFFDKTIVGGAISAVVLMGLILGFIRFCPKLSRPFKWKQDYSPRAVILSSVIGVALHVALDLFA